MSQPHQLTANTKLLHKVVLLHQDKVLILKRSDDAHSRPGAWDLPGGNSEWPAQSQSRFGLHQQDVAREINEETGLSVSASEFSVAALTYFNTFFDSQKQIYTIICGWLHNLADNFDPQSIAISDEHSSWQWLEVARIDELDFGGEAGQFIKDIIKSANK